MAPYFLVQLITHVNLNFHQRVWLLRGLLVVVVTQRALRRTERRPLLSPVRDTKQVTLPPVVFDPRRPTLG